MLAKKRCPQRDYVFKLTKQGCFIVKFKYCHYLFDIFFSFMYNSFWIGGWAVAKNKEIVKIKDGEIVDFFFYKKRKFAILNNKLFKNMPEDILVFVELVLDKNGEELVQPIESDKYEKILKYYKSLVKVINRNKEEK